MHAGSISSLARADSIHQIGSFLAVGGRDQSDRDSSRNSIRKSERGLRRDDMIDPLDHDEFGRKDSTLQRAHVPPAPNAGRAHFFPDPFFTQTEPKILDKRPGRPPIGRPPQQRLATSRVLRFGLIVFVVCCSSPSTAGKRHMHAPVLLQCSQPIAVFTATAAAAQAKVRLLLMLP